MSETTTRVFRAVNKLAGYRQFGSSSRKREVEIENEINYLLTKQYFVTKYLASINISIVKVYMMGKIIKVDYLLDNNKHTIGADLFCSFHLNSETFVRIETINDIVHG